MICELFIILKLTNVSRTIWRATNDQSSRQEETSQQKINITIIAGCCGGPQQSVNYRQVAKVRHPVCRLKVDLTRYVDEHLFRFDQAMD